MKKMGMSDSEKRLLLIVLALLMLVCAYFFGFQKMMEKAQVIEVNNAQDSATVAALEDMVARQAETIQETEEFKSYIDQVIEKYPPDLLQEKSIYLVQQMEDIVGVDYSSISFVMQNILMNFSGARDGELDPVGCYAALSLPFSADYEQFKSLLNYTAEQKDRTTIPNVSVAYDQATGILRGSLTFRMYYLTNTGKVYEDFPATGIESGVSNIFQSEK